jgi:hypothetical protein
VLGRVEPRIWTPPLRDLSRPEASWGYDFIDFCVMIGYELDPWQEWLAIHLGELYPDGTPRYQKAIVLVARQNGKSMFANLLVLYWMFVERVKLVWGTHKDRGEAKKAWREVIEIAEESPILMAALDPLSEKRIIKQIGEEEFRNLYGSNYAFSAPNRKAGRGRSVNRALIDELLTHLNRDCWNSLVPATSAQLNSLVLCLSNEGDERSIVLHEEHDAALDFIETGQGDERTFLASWSSPSGSDPMDLNALAYSNPSMNRPRANGTCVTSGWLLSEARSRIKAGGRTLADFKIEHMCMRIDQLDPAIDLDAYRLSKTSTPIDLAQHRDRLALCPDISLDGTHATLVGAVTLNGKTHAQVLERWTSTKKMREELPGLVAKFKPRKLVWFPSGPAIQVAAALKERKGAERWPPRGVEIEEIRGDDVAAVCMGAAEVIAAGEVEIGEDDVLDQHVKQTKRSPRGDRWVYDRRGTFPIDGTYALGGAIHAARTLKPRTPLHAV